jgi:hypothetical protein
MRAKEWASKFEQDKLQEFIQAYAEETAKVVAERTKGSGIITLANDKKVDTKLAATDGALREQRHKWAAICRALGEASSLTTEMFDKAVLTQLPDVLTVHKAYQESLLKKDEKEKVTSEDVKAGKPGRKLV